MTNEKFYVMNAFDNEGHTIDRYTIWIMNDEGESYLIASSSVPTHPQGVWSIEENASIDLDSLNDEEEDNSHIGKEVDWDILPYEVKNTIENYFDME